MATMEIALWNRLPPEVQLWTLRIFAISEYTNGASLTSCTTVSRSWQAITEAIIFSELRIRLQDLTRFSQIMRGARQKYVKHIGLIIDLPEEPRLDIEVTQGTEEEIAMSQMMLMVLRGRRTYSILPALLDQANKNDLIFTDTLRKCSGMWSRLHLTWLRSSFGEAYMQIGCHLLLGGELEGAVGLIIEQKKKVKYSDDSK